MTNFRQPDGVFGTHQVQLGRARRATSTGADRARYSATRRAMNAIRLRSAALLALAIILAACADSAPGDAAQAAATRADGTPDGRSDVAAQEPVARGRYLVEGLLRCVICHSPRDWDEPGAPPLDELKGAGFVWRDDGTYRLVAPNLTPDAQTGIGRWTDEQLVAAIREGIAHDGRRLHGAMPSFRHLADADAAAVIAYLRSLPPVRNPLPRTALSAEEQARVDAGRPRQLKPLAIAGVTDPSERGRRLMVLGECVGCHTSWHSSRMPGMLGGGNLIHRGDRQAFSTNLTPHPSGVPYNAEAFIQVMRTGKAGGLSPLMPWIVYGNLSDDDLRAMHAFLRTIHPVAHFVGNAGTPTQCPVCGQVHPLGDLNHLDERPAGVEVDPGIYDDYAGTYYSDEYGFTVQVSRAGNRLFAQWDDMPKAELIPQSPERFLEIGGVAPLRFERDEQGRVTRLISEEVEEVVLLRVAEP